MNGWQLVRQIRYLLRQRKWEGSPSAQNVFASNSVRITPIDIEDMITVGTPNSPCCKINLGRRTSDQQAKGYIAQEVSITLAVQLEGDEMAENAVIGGNRTGGKTSSRGRGLSEIESELFAVLEDVTAMNGMQVQGYGTGSVETARLESQSAFVYCEYTFLFYCTTQLSWLGPTSLVAVASTGGSVSLSWVPVPIGWSSISGADGQIVRWAAGATAPATPTAGSGVGVPSILGTANSTTITGLASGVV